MKKTRPISSLILSLFLLAPPAARALSEDSASFNESIELFKNRDFAKSFNLLAQLARKNPNTALYWFNLGNAASMLGRYETAIRAYSRVEALQSPLAAAASLYRAKALLKLGRAREASLLLRALLTSSDLSPSLWSSAEAELAALEESARDRALALYREGKENDALAQLALIQDPSDDDLLLNALILVKLNRNAEAEALLNKLKIASRRADIADLARNILNSGRQDESHAGDYWLFAEFAGGWTSNAYSDPTSTSSGLLHGEWGAGGNAWRKESFSLIANYNGSASDSSVSSSLRVISHQVSAQALYERDQKLVSIGPFFKQEIWESSPVTTSAGVRARFRISSETSETGLDLEAASISALQTDKAYLAGSALEARIFHGLIFSRTYLQAALEYDRHATGDITYTDGSVLPYAYQSIGPALRFIWRAQPEWILSAQAYYHNRSYLNPARPGSKARSDRETSFTLKPIRQFSAQTSAYFSLSYVANESTLGSSDVRDENYKSTTALLGLVWDFNR